MRKDAEVTATTEAFDELMALFEVVLTRDDLSATLEEVCRLAAAAVPGADGASVTTFPEGRPQALASDEWSKRFDELQYVEQEGPCLDAYRTGTAFRVRDLLEDPRWPSYAPRAVEQGARSMLSFPMSAQGRVIGALNLYARAVDAFTSEAAALAAIVAAHAGLASQVASVLFGHRELAEQMTDAMKSRAVIEQAKGIVMSTGRFNADQAFEVLVQESQRSHRKLREVAQTLVDRTVAGSGEAADAVASAVLADKDA
jgi:GAF domain-containing protein